MKTQSDIEFDAAIRIIEQENNLLTRWEALGEYFGYPGCCVRAFLYQPRSERTIHQLMVHDDTGFVPCPACAQKIDEGRATLKSLIQNRICTSEFPNNGDDDAMNDYADQFEMRKKKGLTANVEPGDSYPWDNIKF